MTKAQQRRETGRKIHILARVSGQIVGYIIVHVIHSRRRDPTTSPLLAPMWGKNTIYEALQKDFCPKCQSLN